MSQTPLQTRALEPETLSARPKFVRRQIPPIAQYVIATWIYGVMCPLMWTVEKLGRADKLVGRFAERMHRNTVANNPFKNYLPGKQDVFVMTMPKSGTNWMMQIAHQLIWHGEAEYDHIHNVIPWPDIMAMPKFMHGYAIPLVEDVSKFSPEKKRVIKTHFNWELLPYSEDARYIAVIRDPKDVFVSSYFFIRDGLYGPAMPSVDTWYKLFLSGKSLMGIAWPQNTAGYWAQRRRPNVLILSFKSMKRDLHTAVRKVADFLNIRATDKVIQQVCEKSSFEYMKRIDYKFHMGKIIPWREPGAMIRKGTQGGSSELLSPERQREIDAYCMAELKRLGCDLPYEEFCDISQ
jgi:sulfotransferase family protein